MRILLLIILFYSFSCNIREKGYHLSGDIQGLDGSIVYIQKRSGEGFIYTDSSANHNGKFELEGYTKFPEIVTVWFKNKSGKDEPLCNSFYLENSAIHLFGSIKNRGKIRISGSKENDTYLRLSSVTAFPEKYIQLQNLFYKSWSEGVTLPKDSVVKWKIELGTLEKEHSIRVKDAVNKYAGTTAAIDCALENLGYYDVSELKHLLKLFPGQKNSRSYRKLENVVHLGSDVKEGNKFALFTLPDSLGMEHSLMHIKSKRILIDFWASWCGPCRRQIPAIKSLYQKSSREDLEIISISIDSEKNAWLKALNQENMNWTNLIAPSPDWAMNHYLVTAIPHLILLDSSFNIIAKNISVSEVEGYLGSDE